MTRKTKDVKTHKTAAPRQSAVGTSEEQIQACAQDTERTPEEIGECIHLTRKKMDHTLDALEERVSPVKLVDDAIDYLWNSFRGSRDRTSGAISQNPTPYALVGIALMLGGVGMAAYAFSRMGARPSGRSRFEPRSQEGRTIPGAGYMQFQQDEDQSPTSLAATDPGLFKSDVDDTAATEELYREQNINRRDNP